MKTPTELLEARLAVAGGPEDRPNKIAFMAGIEAIKVLRDQVAYLQKKLETTRKRELALWKAAGG